MYSLIHHTTTVTVHTHKDLLQMWRGYGPLAQMLIGTVVCERPITEAQRRRLPALLRERLQ